MRTRWWRRLPRSELTAEPQDILSEKEQLERMKLKHFLIPHTNINSKWIKDLNLRPETIKLLGENIGKTLSDINHKILYDPPPRVMGIKAKINKWDLIKQKLLHNEGNYKQGEKTAFRIGENSK